MKVSRTQSELDAIKAKNSNSKKVLYAMFETEKYLTSHDIAKHVDLDLKTIQSTLTYIRLHNQAELDMVRFKGKNRYLLVSINPSAFGLKAKHIYTTENGINIYGLAAIGQYLKIDKKKLNYQINKLGKGLDEAIDHLSKIGEVGKKENKCFRFVKKANNCPEPTHVIRFASDY